ncbi:threonine aspartase 1 [Culicoides brevitarsis]|uniref:threonine aspartase 1 n=1 Tax=Culicoides brevitarsis TaxID=469753 RepID=UPI00307C1856
MPAGFIAVHTGCGNAVDQRKYKNVSNRACERAIAVLLRDGGDGTTMEACEAAIRELEDSGETNAGFGSNLTWEGRVECEASIMDGASRLFGACTNVSRVKNPISLARVVCEKQNRLLKLGRIPPMVVSGQGAEAFAAETNIEMVENEEQMISKKALKCYRLHKETIQKYESINDIKISSLDTVGAVCVDAAGNITAGCSSGGLILKVSGRIGQAATYGAGCWASMNPNSSIATCTTGNGEYLMKTLLAKEIVSDLTASQCPITTINTTFQTKFLKSPFLSDLDEVYGGALTIDYDHETRRGDLLWAHTTKYMCLGYMSTGKRKPKFLMSEMPDIEKAGKVTIVSGHQFKLPQ